LRYAIETLEKISLHKIEIKINQKFVRAGEIESMVGNHGKLDGLIKANIEPICFEDTLKWMYEE